MSSISLIYIYMYQDILPLCEHSDIQEEVQDAMKLHKRVSTQSRIVFGFQEKGNVFDESRGEMEA